MNGIPALKAIFITCAAAMGLIVLLFANCGDALFILYDTNDIEFSQKAITSFVFTTVKNPGLLSDATGTVNADTVTVIVPDGTDISGLAPDITINGLSISPANGVTQDFSSGPVIYTVTAEDMTIKDYTITVEMSPSPGNSGILTFSEVTNNLITVNWTKATDNISAQADLQYCVYYSTIPDVDTIANIETNGTAINSYTADIDTITLPGLAPLTAYYFNVIVRDEANCKSAYVMNSRITTTGPVALAPSPVTASLTADGSFTYPHGICTDGTNLYVTDITSHTISSVDISTGVVNTIGGTGTAGSADGTGTLASFNTPRGICTDGLNLYIADSGNKSIRKMTIAGQIVTTIATGFSDTSSLFGLTTDGTTIYVSDCDLHKIYTVNISTGTKTWIAGDGTSGTVDATGTAASFMYPRGLCTDGIFLYISDFGTNKIRKINIETKAVTTIGTFTSYNAGQSYGRYIVTDGTYTYNTDYWFSVQKIEISSGTDNRYDISGVFSAGQIEGVTTDGDKIYVVDVYVGKISSLK